jgi:glycopeptide antibiotics resistance protein
MQHLSENKYSKAVLTAAISWTLFLIAAMLTPGDKFPEADLFNFQDKFIHFVCFGVLTYLWCGVGWQYGLNLSPKKALALNYLVFGFSAGIIFELLQRFIPFRSFEIMDMIFNELGGLVGLIAHLKFPIKKNGLD